VGERKGEGSTDEENQPGGVYQAGGRSIAVGREKGGGLTYGEKKKNGAEGWRGGGSIVHLCV